MIRKWLTALFMFTACNFALCETAQSAADLLHEALRAMGGEEKVRSLRTVHFEATSVRYMLEQSERPEGPYLIENSQIEEWRDLQDGMWKRRTVLHGSMQPQFEVTEVVSGGAASLSYNGKLVAASGEQLQDAQESLALSPERLLITALDSVDLRRLADLVLQQVPHHVVEFTCKGVLVRVYLNADSDLPTEVEWVNAYPYGIFWSIWGDITTRVFYSFWWMQNGIHYPLQSDLVRNGMQDQTVTITKLDFDAPFPANEFVISSETRHLFETSTRKTIEDRAPTESPNELEPGIQFLPGAWNTTIVLQEDGIVILEAPISSGYSARVIELTKRKYPGMRIKAVLTTSDSWPHIGGLREYVAQGVPVYVLDRTVPLIERLFKSPRKRYPDDLARNPRPAKLHPVSSKTIVGKGSTRLEIYPIHGETSERQMMVYFPQFRLLYGSDPFQQLDDGQLFYPQTAYELKSAVEREHLEVDRFFMMHMEPTHGQQCCRPSKRLKGTEVRHIFH